MSQNGRDNGLAIDLHDVRKTYRGKVKALRGIEMQVNRGEVFGLLGPNGAGKSTLVKIMMTVVRPTKAEGRVLGKPVGHKPTLARVGYLPEHHRFPKYLRGEQVLDFYGALSGMPRRDRKARISELLDIVGMTDWRRHRIGQYSKGMMQRIGLAQALINNPDLVVLDEPTDGVDPVGRREIRDVLLRIKDEGRTVFINSHLLSELEMICERVSILVQGKVAMQGTIDDLTADSRRYEIDLPGAAPTWASEACDQVRTLPNGASVLEIHRPDAADAQGLIDRLRADGQIIAAVRPVREKLEDLFMRAITDPDTGAAFKPGASSSEGDDA